ncbi:MAG: chemotaxis-specific protein-glutamate methyltransferase CheB [Thermodesulfovibrionales bacterium]|nr:chemotaxis-specific protein-glutamate methyltransferase CheB [Thermodesulfovibrionales bacterium]
MQKTRVLIVDDSLLVRDLIKAILSTDDELAVVGEAGNGREAVEKNMELKPDIITMDIEMPVMNGLDAIEKIMAIRAVPILVVTTYGDAKVAFAAISKGALDLVVKPDVNIEAAGEFIKKIKMLSKVRVFTHIAGKFGTAQKPPESPPSGIGSEVLAGRVVAIASSTGGPDALSVILSMLPEKYPCPLLIAQHISEGFAKGMVEWLGPLTKMKVKVAEEGEMLVAGTAYVSPSERHMVVRGSKRISFIDRRPADIYRPSCDILLSSVADAFGNKSVGIILTGMGNDGVMGIKRIKEAGGLTIAQDEKTSVIFGMPKVAIESGFVDKVLSIENICRELAKITGVQRNAASAS